MLSLINYQLNAPTLHIHHYSSGTFGMEAVARQFATDEHVMVIRNGWFSFRWTEIFDIGGPESAVLYAKFKVSEVDAGISVISCSR